MNNRAYSLPLAILFLCGIAMCIAGICFFTISVDSTGRAEQSIKNAKSAGTLFIVLGSIFVLVGSSLAFVGAHLRAARKGE